MDSVLTLLTAINDAMQVPIPDVGQYRVFAAVTSMCCGLVTICALARMWYLSDQKHNPLSRWEFDCWLGVVICFGWLWWCNLIAVLLPAFWLDAYGRTVSVGLYWTGAAWGLLLILRNRRLDRLGRHPLMNDL